MLSGQIRVFLDLDLMLQTVHDLFERLVIIFVLLLNTHHHVAIHLNESAIGVPCKTWVLRRIGQSFGGCVIEAQVQNSVHHAGHGIPCPRTDRNQQRILDIPKLFTGLFLKPLDGLLQFAGKLRWILAPVLVIVDANFGRNRKTRGNRQSNLGHLS